MREPLVKKWTTEHEIPRFRTYFKFLGHGLMLKNDAAGRVITCTPPKPFRANHGEDRKAKVGPPLNMTIGPTLRLEALQRGHRAEAVEPPQRALKTGGHLLQYLKKHPGAS